MRNVSHSRILSVAAALLVSFSLFGPFVRTVSGFFNSGCVGETQCQENPPAGKSCCKVDGANGSTPQDDGVAATSDSCSYVYDGSAPGPACGSAIPDVSGSSCD
jgi:hypothetical protein